MEALLKKDIYKVNAEKIRILRHSELRRGEDFSTTSYLRDNDNETFHLAYVKEKKIVVCATFYPEFSERAQAVNAYRLRGLATESSLQRRGYATDLMQESFKELKKRDCDVLWCNARLAAVDFYKSIGFKIIGDQFDISPIGPHNYMYKKIY